MARRYRPPQNFNVAMKILNPTSTMVEGVRVDSSTDVDDAPLIYGSFRTYGGTENTSNDVYTIFDTAHIETWYRPDITTDSQIYVCETGRTYRVISTPEDINMRHQFLSFRVERVGGRP